MANNAIQDLIVKDVISLLDRLTVVQIKDELRRLNIKGYSKLNASNSVQLLKDILNENTDEILNIYKTYKLELDMFQKEVLEVLNIKKAQLDKLDINVTGIQRIYIKTHHDYKKYDRESVYRLMNQLEKIN